MGVASSPMARKQLGVLSWIKEGGIYAVLLILLAVIIIQEPSFVSLRNLSNILTQSSVRIIIALGVASLIVTQGTDLSAGRQVGLAAVISATLLQALDNVNRVFPEISPLPIPAVILLVCALGALIGVINGLVIAYMKVTPFIATMGSMIIVYGINSLYYDYVGASPVAGFAEQFSEFTQGFIRLGDFRLSYITFYAIIAIIFSWVLWNKTVFGKNIFAIGGNPEAARVSGVNVPLTLLKVDALSGVFYAFAGLLEAGRNQPVLAVHYQGRHYYFRCGPGFHEVRGQKVAFNRAGSPQPCLMAGTYASVLARTGR